MKNNTPSREQLIKRRDEINAQLSRTENDLRIELERDPEDQAIQLEQDQVSITMEQNLRKELAMIEDQLDEMDENE